MKKPAGYEFDQLINEHFKIALAEVGTIKPWFDPECQALIFEHELYPVEYGGDTKEEVIERYPLYLRGFIEERLKGNLSDFTEARTRGRAGKRSDAGKPVRTTRKATAVIRLPLNIANWIKAVLHI